MATRATVTRNENTATASWDLADGETGDAVDLSAYPDKTIQGVGSGSAALHGSNDGGTTYAALNDTGGTAIAVTGGSFAVVKENPKRIRPVATGAVKVYIVASE